MLRYANRLYGEAPIEVAKPGMPAPCHSERSEESPSPSMREGRVCPELDPGVRMNLPFRSSEGRRGAQKTDTRTQGDAWCGHGAGFPRERGKRPSQRRQSQITATPILAIIPNSKNSSPQQLDMTDTHVLQQQPSAAPTIIGTAHRKRRIAASRRVVRKTF